ncbi:MAG: hypothetical protein IJG87_06625 [Ruminococcus sp.]|nr:hypothetical protein [Ruminococcus sp.]
MQQITVTIDLTPKNLDILKQLCVPAGTGAAPTVEHPVTDPFPEPQATAKPQAVEEAPKISKTDVKAVCLKLSKEGKQDALKAAFAKFGAKKLTEVQESDYPALMKELANA